jgi:hypothetical protein
VPTFFSNRTKTALGCGVAAGLVGGLLLTQQAFAGTTDNAGVRSVPSPAAGSLSAAPVSATEKKWVTSDVSQLEELGIQINESVLIDVADDGRNRYLSVMFLKPAKVAKKAKPAKNRVVIAPPFYNEDLGPGSCVADTKRHILRLATCKKGAKRQTWHVIPAGDSGQFELHGVYTKIRVHNGRITTGDRGYVGLQTIDFS